MPSGAWLGGTATLTWAAPAPIEPESRDELFEIRARIWARRMAGDKVEILSDTIGLALGVEDVLLARNLDDVPQVFGPVAEGPGARDGDRTRTP